MKKVTLFFATILLGCVSASAWVPPENPDPHVILEEARQDAKSGRNEVALAKFVWYHENALRIVPALKGVRLSFALSYWYELAEDYPPARVAMEQARTTAARHVLSGRNVRDAFHDLSALDRRMGREDRTKELFEKLDRDHPEVAKKVFPSAESALVQRKAFGLANRYIAPADIEKTIERYRRQLRTAPEMMDPEGPREFARKWFSNRASTLVALLAVNGRSEEAEAVAAAARSEFRDPDFEQRLVEALEGIVPKPWPSWRSN